MSLYEKILGGFLAALFVCFLAVGIYDKVMERF